MLAFHVSSLSAVSPGKKGPSVRNMMLAPCPGLGPMHLYMRVMCRPTWQINPNRGPSRAPTGLNPPPRPKPLILGRASRKTELHCRSPARPKPHTIGNGDSYHASALHPRWPPLPMGPRHS